MKRMPEIMLPAEVWSPLVSYKPPYILDANGIVQYEPLAKLLRTDSGAFWFFDFGESNHLR